MAEPMITADMLPGLLAEIARVTTPAIAIAVARQFGGRRLYLPRQLKPGHPLVDLVGQQAAALILHRLGDGRHDVPAARTILRWHDAHRLRADGLTHAQISAALSITQHYVMELLSGAPIGASQAARQAKIQARAERQAKKRAIDGRQMSLF